MNKVSFLILPFWLFALVVLAQTDYVSDFNSLTNYETEDTKKHELLVYLTESLIDDLKVTGFELDSLSVRQLKIAYSPDSLICLYTWHYSLSDATAQYGGVLKHGGEYFPLYFNDSPIVEDKEYTSENWCGGIYYDIIPLQHKGKVVYTLLSWDGNNGITSKKIIDVLTFDRRGEPVFGLPIFRSGRKGIQRVVLEYPANNSMYLEYDEREGGIFCNAFFTNDDKFVDVAAYQSTSDDFNVYRYEDAKWNLYLDVDMLMDKKESNNLRKQNVRPSSGL